MQTITVTLASGREAELREISAREMMNADLCAKGFSSEEIQTQMLYYRTVAALARLGDEQFSSAQSDLELDSRIDMLSAADFNQLRQAYRQAFEEAAITAGSDIEVRDITARQQMTADTASKGVPRCMAYYRSAMALQRIGEKTYDPPATLEALEERINELSGPQIEAIGSLFMLKFAATEANAKNS